MKSYRIKARLFLEQLGGREDTMITITGFAESGITKCPLGIFACNFCKYLNLSISKPTFDIPYTGNLS